MFTFLHNVQVADESVLLATADQDCLVQGCQTEGKTKQMCWNVKLIFLFLEILTKVKTSIKIEK